ncbi:NAD(P)-dependent oxidoreductase [Anaeropeptidivorans aminofermentans]|jgi:glutamate synthase (NADPH/NADH) small chain|uniref:NAD(P)-dependent oxidoreductase n=1 Tax=Anaeropeptidivorans aminofermentans TaxID=2934315 RepID=UPI002024AACC|nr:NAD(P)-dependent oxidoreductase [Anaeropeptidivorans aminofermentans]
MAQSEYEKNTSYTMQEAINEAKRCLRCKVPACQKGCPINNDIPDFIYQLSKGNLGEAREILAKKTNLPAVCGRVCPHEKQCVGHCVLNAKGNPIQVGGLEQFIADFDAEMGLIKENIAQKTRGKVAVIGSGPAGLTVAGDLAREGFNVIIYENESEPGGVLLYGIPEFRLPKAVVRREIKKIEALGVTFLTNVTVGKDLTIDDMFSQNFDAIFIGTGTALARDLEIEGREKSGVIQSTYFLRMIALYNAGSVDEDEVPVSKEDKVVIVGAGNVAMDAARTALRYGASSVTIVYRKGLEDMPALKTEYKSALDEGVEFIWYADPVEFTGDHTVKGLKFKKDGEIKEIEADVIMLAVGSRPASRIVSTTTGIGVNDSGYVITKDKPYGMTTRKGVFAGGDVVHKPATVVLAMKEAKKVAEGIASYVDAIKLLEL